MKIILLQDVKKIGKKFDIKDVADGFALNMLIPQKKAKVATANAIKEIENAKKEYREKEQVRDEELISNIEALTNTTINIPAKVNEEGHLFAGIGKNEIILAIKDQKALDIEPEHIILDKPIKEIGDGMEVEVKAAGKSAKFKIEIVKSE